ncbi:MAG TPA: metallophosphoesterase [Anaerolineales bacterium]|nr:metallophosphoesterase [Anaerolineales bacterium]
MPISHRALVLSDSIAPIIYSPHLRARFPDTNLVIGCGDLPYYYLEYIVSAMDVPLYFVRGNHDKLVEYSSDQTRSSPWGGTDLHRKVVKNRGLLLAGVEGSLRYREGPFQYSQNEMWWHVFSLLPGLLVNRVRHGRYLDVFVTHAPPRGIHDKDDLPHQGIRAFRWLIETFQPRYHFHGHIHIYRPDASSETKLGLTRVINAYGYGETLINID